MSKFYWISYLFLVVDGVLFFDWVLFKALSAYVMVIPMVFLSLIGFLVLFLMTTVHSQWFDRIFAFIFRFSSRLRCLQFRTVLPKEIELQTMFFIITSMSTLFPLLIFLSTRAIWVFIAFAKGGSARELKRRCTWRSYGQPSYTSIGVSVFSFPLFFPSILSYPVFDRRVAFVSDFLSHVLGKKNIDFSTAHQLLFPFSVSL